MLTEIVTNNKQFTDVYDYRPLHCDRVVFMPSTATPSGHNAQRCPYHYDVNRLDQTVYRR